MIYNLYNPIVYIHANVYSEHRHACKKRRTQIRSYFNTYNKKSLQSYLHIYIISGKDRYLKEINEISSKTKPLCH